jgi:hypothetical protein
MLKWSDVTTRLTTSEILQLTPWSKALLEKLIITHFYGARRLITMFTRARHWSLSWTRCIQSTTSHPTSLRSILILSSQVFRVVSSLQVFKPKFCMNFLFLPCVLHVTSVSPSLIWSVKYYSPFNGWNCRNACILVLHIALIINLRHLISPPADYEYTFKYVV